MIELNNSNNTDGTILTVHELTKIFPHPSKKRTNVPIFGSASFVFNATQPNFIVGVSGSGKTTLFRMLASLEPIDAGEIFLNECTVHLLKGKEKRAYLRSLGFLDQFPAKLLHLTLTARENLDDTLLIRTTLAREERKKRILEVAEAFHLATCLEKKAIYLSGGELRRLSLACSIIFHPTMLLCDEPTSQLDEENKKKIMKSIHTLNESFDTLVVVATHDRGILPKKAVYEIKERKIFPCQ